MQFGEEKRVEKTGKFVGFVITLILFSLGLFIILNLTRKLPVSWNYLHILLISFLITFIGFILKKYLAS